MGKEKQEFQMYDKVYHTGGGTRTIFCNHVVKISVILGYIHYTLDDSTLDPFSYSDIGEEYFKTKSDLKKYMRDNYE